MNKRILLSIFTVLATFISTHASGQACNNCQPPPHGALLVVSRENYWNLHRSNLLFIRAVSDPNCN
jgi:hypothetical protein